MSDMILLAKSERPNFLHVGTFSIRTFVEDLLTKARVLADRNWQLKGEGDDAMVGDRQHLTGAMLNLLRNAAQHTEVGDSIEIGYRIDRKHPAGSQVEFWVRDQGDGISPENQQRIFARFARGAQRRSEGSGLGLAIVKTVAEAHGGHVHLVSRVGEGSTFWIILPQTIQGPKPMQSAELKS